MSATATSNAVGNSGPTAHTPIPNQLYFAAPAESMYGAHGVVQVQAASAQLNQMMAALTPQDLNGVQQNAYQAISEYVRGLNTTQIEALQNQSMQLLQEYGQHNLNAVQPYLPGGSPILSVEQGKFLNRMGDFMKQLPGKIVIGPGQVNTGGGDSGGGLVQNPNKRTSDQVTGGVYAPPSKRLQDVSDRLGKAATGITIGGTGLSLLKRAYGIASQQPGQNAADEYAQLEQVGAPEGNEVTEFDAAGRNVMGADRANARDALQKMDDETQNDLFGEEEENMAGLEDEKWYDVEEIPDGGSFANGFEKGSYDLAEDMKGLDASVVEDVGDATELTEMGGGVAEVAEVGAGMAEVAEGVGAAAAIGEAGVAAALMSNPVGLAILGTAAVAYAGYEIYSAITGNKNGLLADMGDWMGGW